jgi:phosphoribosylaminoimidazolecarboxamide formyltransferase/IMP cyclohydrolase
MKPELQASLTGKKIAFISVFDKQKLEPLARTLVEKYNYVLVSTGGTKKYLDERQIPVLESSEITGFEELLGGRVKSLHPEIFAGILAEEKDRGPQANLPFAVDTVVVNLYPFEAERDRLITESGETDPLHLLHFVDIGGPSLIRAAAKNFPVVNVLSHAGQYDDFLAELEKGQGRTGFDFRKRLAVEAFAQTAYYDSLIHQYFLAQLQANKQAPLPDALPDMMTLPLAKITNLRYGENPHQKAALYGLARRETDFEALHGKELSYNNILDMQAAWNIVTEYAEHPACVIVKHNNPCGVAISTRSTEDAFMRALDTDPLSAFGGVVAFNQIVSEGAAKAMKDIFLEVVIAPGFAPAAFDLLSSKKNLRLIRRALPEKQAHPLEFKQVADTLFLVQGVDDHLLSEQESRFKVATAQKPTDTQLEDMVFAWKVVKHVKSNAMVLAKEGRTVGIGGGQTSRIGALENALKLACDQAKGAVLASDGFLPHEDNIYAAAQARVGAIIQPGGSVKDPDVIQLANQYKIAMVTTGVREFKH